MRKKNKQLAPDGLTVGELIDLLKDFPSNWPTNIRPDNNSIVGIHAYSDDYSKEAEYVLLGKEAMTVYDKQLSLAKKAKNLTNKLKKKKV